MSSVTSHKSNTPDSDEIDLGRLIGELIDHRKLIIFITSICVFFAVVYAIFSTPIYQAVALIQVEQKQGNAILNSLSQVLPDSQPQSQPELALLQSRMILGKTVDDLNLQARVEQNYFPIFGRGLARITGEKPAALSVSHLYIPVSDSGDQEITLTVIDSKNYTITGENFKLKGFVGRLLEDRGISLMVRDISAEPGTSFNITYLSRLSAINELQDAFSVADQGKDTGMLNLSFTGDNPTQVDDILNSISNNYLAQNITRQSAQDAKSLDFLSKQLPAVRSELDIAEDKLNAYRQQKNSVDLSLEAKSMLDQIVNIDNQLNELTFRESEISQLYTKEHPIYKALLEKRQTLQEERNKLNKRVSSMPETQQEVMRLSRDVESGRAVYMQLLNRQQELNIAKSSVIGNVRIIDSAVTLPKPVKPKKTMIVLIGMILGVMISVGLVLLRIYLRRGIESPEQLEELGINVYASVPISEALSKAAHRRGAKQKLRNELGGFLAIDNPADLAIEAIRGLRTSLHFAMMDASNNVLMISGASPKAGKTFISTNLAAIIAQTGKKVLFIDTDMRRGYSHKIFNVSKDKGLSDYLAGKIAIGEAIKKIPSAGFDFISCGMVPPNPAELLMHSRFDEIIKWANERYDLVVIDTPPILAVTDAAIIGRYAGTSLILARFEENTVKQIQISINRFEQAGVTIKGCILNGVVKRVSNYYAYGYTHYGYSYSDKRDQ